MWHPPGNVRSKSRQRLGWAIALTLLLFVAEFAGGLWANSLALLSDAGHMLADILALTLSFLSLGWAARAATPQKTYGYYRLEVLATAVNGALLLYVALQIAWEALHRFLNPEAVDVKIMLPFAVAGALINLLCAVLLRKEHDHLVGRSALYHVLSDLASSIGVIIAGVAILFTGLRWLDTLAALVITVLIFVNAMKLLRETYDILMEGSPAHLDLEEVREEILKVAEIKDLQDLHVWTIGSDLLAATAHLQVENMDTRRSEDILQQVADLLRERYGITHTTFQIMSKK